MLELMTLEHNQYILLILLDRNPKNLTLLLLKYGQPKQSILRLEQL